MASDSIFRAPLGHWHSNENQMQKRKRMYVQRGNGMNMNWHTFYHFSQGQRFFNQILFVVHLPDEILIQFFFIRSRHIPLLAFLVAIYLFAEENHIWCDA